MLLGQNLLKQTDDDYLPDCANLAKARSTLIFIDMNIIAYMFKLHAAVAGAALSVRHTPTTGSTANGQAVQPIAS